MTLSHGLVENLGTGVGMGVEKPFFRTRARPRIPSPLFPSVRSVSPRCMGADGRQNQGRARKVSCASPLFR